MSLEDAYALFQEAQSEVATWLLKETTTLRSGRVKPDLVNNLSVEHYGTRTSLQGLATITNSDARTLVVAPWDPSALAAIEKAITQAGLGVQPSVDGKIVRLSFPSLTEEVRAQTTKILHKKAEEARVRLRRARDEALAMLKSERTAGSLTEDDFYDGRAKLDALIDSANADVENLVKKKEEEIRTV
jgi:ribosome recycling factor